ncbi:hypothetical protein PENTCL1PPCAC_14970 [Pristionchus entomophagus]|uniref:Uncharacterized protein n=1 Tax=Pristionchus entomophagus TaxID=358040 RepID=A0AAV5TB65_9BILA|nr:hypothetical protein PENTCL1PPCAC_14970 [Pristionchus entomophagus]
MGQEKSAVYGTSSVFSVSGLSSTTSRHSFTSRAMSTEKRRHGQRHGRTSITLDACSTCSRSFRRDWRRRTRWSRRKGTKCLSRMRGIATNCYPMDTSYASSRGSIASSSSLRTGVSPDSQLYFMTVAKQEIPKTFCSFCQWYTGDREGFYAHFASPFHLKCAADVLKGENALHLPHRTHQCPQKGRHRVELKEIKDRVVYLLIDCKYIFFLRLFVVTR